MEEAKKTEEKMEQKEAPTWAKVSVLIGLVLVLIIGLILPVKIVPQAASMLSSTISSLFIPREKTEKSEEIITTATSTVSNKQTTATSTKTVTKDSTTPTTVVKKKTAPYGLADLEVRIIAVGFLNKDNVFIPSNTIYSDQQAAVKFQIINVGTNNTGSWGFYAELPSITDKKYTSTLQQSLRPGDRIEYVLGFRNPTADQIHTGSIVANPTNSISEYSKINNVAKVAFPIVNMTLKSQTASVYSAVSAPKPVTGAPDLSVKILETGTINRSTGQFTKTDSVTANDRVGVRVEVENKGGNISGPWKFQATLPTSNSQQTNYVSADQTSLSQGEKTIIVISFDSIKDAGNNYFIINIDPFRMINESSITNNSATAVIFRN